MNNSKASLLIAMLCSDNEANKKTSYKLKHLSEKKTQKRFDVGKKLATCNMNLFAPSFSLEISGRP